MNLHLELLSQLAVWSKNYTFYYLQKFTIDDVKLIKSQLLISEKQESCTKQIFV